MRTPTPSLRTLRRGAFAAALAGASVLGTAGVAGAAIVQPGPTPTPTVPRPPICQIVIGGCPDVTNFTFNHSGQYVDVYATFPQGATGNVTYKLKCADGFTKQVTVAIAKNVHTYLKDKDEHPGAQICTVSQSVKKGFTTTVKELENDPDELWNVDHIGFTNV